MIVILTELGFSIYGAILGSISASLVQLIISRFHVRPPLWSNVRLHFPGFWKFAVPLSLFGISVSLLGLVAVAEWLY